MSWEIDKEFAFEYGHRVWSQNVDKVLSSGSCNKCRHIHGHSGRIKVGLSSLILQDGMVTDFNNLTWFKNWLDDTLDHKTIVDINDPLIGAVISKFYEDEMPLIDKGTHKIIEEQGDYLDEYYSSFVIVDFVPTSENFCKWIYDMIKEKMPELVYVDFYETAKSHSRYQ